jgi:predicted transcriptional regulator
LSKKSVLQNHISYDILYKTRNLVTPNEIVNELNISKQRVHYWLTKFKKEEWVESPLHGHYEITDSGKTILDTYEQQFNKDLVRLENMRYKCSIVEGAEYLKDIVKSKWKYNSGLKNVDVFYTKIQDFSISAFLGKNPVLTINTPKKLGTNIYEMMHWARTEVDALAEIIEKDYSITLGRMEDVMQPEWAIPSEFAKVLLNKTNSSQIRTPKGVINKSKGRGYDVETRDIRLANKIYNLPFVVDDIALQLDEITLQLKQLRAASNTGWFCF